MRISRIAAAAAVTAAVALPIATASTASAASPATAVTASDPCGKVGPYKVHASAVTIRSKASAKSTALGLLYKGHKFTVHKATTYGEWVYITDKSTGVTGWVSGIYVYPDVSTCLH
ncbi:SH3 domain-containing protein [Streptomyces sp. WAC 06725]|uniref:SH3 domain-containing protein n=1 Tax=Streptomyces sp. WAC 06725 TaxID=2203209 RepID=UPI000F744160|nr:SH3 domain-containing protein [Streptomyces sp. WAC 06725]RSO24304.1 SH3 domain-containing protein [Streptomyces sp. WAC 06725]